MEFGDGEVEVMGGDVDIDKFLRITCKVREVLALLIGNIIRKGDPVDEITFSCKSGEDDIVHIFVSCKTGSAWNGTGGE